MKRIAASREHDMSKIGQLEQIAQEIAEDMESILLPSGYEVFGEYLDTITLTVTCRHTSPASMPVIDLEVEEGDGEYQINPYMSFPTLSFDPNHDTATTMEYWLDEWSKVGKYIKDIIEYKYIPEV